MTRKTVFTIALFLVAFLLLAATPQQANAWGSRWGYQTYAKPVGFDPSGGYGHYINSLAYTSSFPLENYSGYPTTPAIPKGLTRFNPMYSYPQMSYSSFPATSYYNAPSTTGIMPVSTGR